MPPATTARLRGARCRFAAHEQGERGARRELPDARRRLEVRDRRLGCRLDDRVRERGSADHRDDRGAAQPHGAPRLPRAQAGGRDQEQGPRDVELLLDAERPVVEHGVLGAAERQVVDRFERELPVRVVERGRDRIEAHGRAEDRRREELHADGDGDQHERRQREQSPRAPRVERPQRDRSGPLELVDEQSGDQEARDHVEHVHADVAAGEPGTPAWKATTRITASARRPLDVRPERPPARARRAGAVPAYASRRTSSHAAISIAAAA